MSLCGRSQNAGPGTDAEAARSSNDGSTITRRLVSSGGPVLDDWVLWDFGPYLYRDASCKLVDRTVVASAGQGESPAPTS
jgi:hypothetical protein